MKIDLNQEEIDRLIKAVKTDKNFCERTIRQEGILPDYRERLVCLIKEYNRLLGKLVQPAEKISNLHTTQVFDEGILILAKKLTSNQIQDIQEICEGRSVELNHTYVVTKCIHDFDLLFVLLDRMGITHRMGGVSATTKELYNKCIEINPGLNGL